MRRIADEREQFPVLRNLVDRPFQGNLLSIPEEYVELLPESVAREHVTVPLGREGETLYVAAVDEGAYLIDKLQFLLNTKIQIILYRRKKIAGAIDYLYGSESAEVADSMLQEFAYAGAFGATAPTANEEFSGTLRQPESGRVMSKRSRSEMGFGQQRGESKYASQQISYKKNHPGREGMFFYTVNEGHQVLAYRNNGRIDRITGPARVWKGTTVFREMQHYVAHPGSFLVVHFKDGRKENISGPAEIWFDPRVHSRINVEEGLNLAAKEAVVVYGQDEVGSTSRRICYGPTTFIAEPGEWLHQFSWHASRGGFKGVDKKPHGLKFQKLWLMPDQMYHDVMDVRTADDAVIEIRLMIFFELLDIEKMLDTTHDPIGDFVNAATSDVVEFTGKRTFAEFKQQTEQLNELATYTQLLNRAEQCGYQINNVVYRGYGAPDSLQKMHDEAIQARTRLQLEKATETQTQELEDYRLTCQVERAERRRQEQTTEVEHDLLIQSKREESKLNAEKQQEDFKREQIRLRGEQELQRMRDQQLLQREHYEQLRSMGVDLTQFLTQGRADQVIELRGKGNNQPHLHLNENGRLASINGTGDKS